MNKTILIFAVLFQPSHASYAQSYSLSGFVFDEETRSPLWGAQVQVCNRTQISDSMGHFAFALLPDSTCPVRVTFVGYRALTYDSVSISHAPCLILILQPGRDCTGVEDRAKLDLAHGRVYLWFTGLTIIPSDSYPSRKRELDRKYGFEAIERGCTEACADKYNSIARIYLDRRNGPGWWERYLHELNDLK